MQYIARKFIDKSHYVKVTDSEKNTLAYDGHKRFYTIGPEAQMKWNQWTINSGASFAKLFLK